ncbi:MAG TPA: methyltransferase domain-containing protein [Kofleriaceae bacterium]|nr:methyltransferase domain-containing protein [Kofleriaceae bacterium]
MYLPLLDRLLYRRPFEGGSARRYADDERPAFGDLDDRLLDRLAPQLTAPAGPPAAALVGASAGPPASALVGPSAGPLVGASGRRLLDLGCGPATFARRAAERFPGLTVVAVEPSHDFARPGIVRAVGEALPLADRSIDVAICLSSIRHVRDRAATLRELRRVVRGLLVIVELDPDADARRVATHAHRLASPVVRRLFAPLVLRTAPPSHVIAALAREAGFTVRELRADPIQPVYVMDLV